MPIEIQQSPVTAVAARRSVPIAVLRGLQCRCPNCGVGASLRSYLKVRDHCAHCGEALGQIRADDFPPYATIVLVGHIVVPLVLWTEQVFAPPLAAQLAVWPLLALALTLWTLPYVKGAIVGLMWALRLRGDETQ